MVTEVSPSTRQVGFWSATLATVFSLTYVVAQLAEWLGLLGSRGGPESASTVLGIVILLTPSLFLGASFLILTVSVHQLASADRSVWSHAAVAFATMYAALISIVYFVQLTLRPGRWRCCFAAPRSSRVGPLTDRPHETPSVRGQRWRDERREQDQHPDAALQDVVVSPQTAPRIAEQVVPGEELECERQHRPHAADHPRVTGGQ
jgi:hypothetical protein